jgi:hypothetical protein
MNKFIKKSADAENYIRMLWSPKPGDRVQLLGVRTFIDDITEHGCSLQDIPATFFLPSQLRYRVDPREYEKVLDQLQHLFNFREKQSDGKWIASIRINKKSSMIFKGRARKILMHLLELRIADIEINQAINDLVNQASRGPQGAIRFHIQEA